MGSMQLFTIFYFSFVASTLAATNTDFQKALPPSFRKACSRFCSSCSPHLLGKRTWDPERSDNLSYLDKFWVDKRGFQRREAIQTKWYKVCSRCRPQCNL